MADENGEDTPMRTEEGSDSGSEDGSDNSDSSSSEEEVVELLVNTREKRSTAGNRLTSLLQQEEPDDELELLFAEDGDDEGYEDDQADSDVQMDSSDDDDDQGPAAGAEDLEGEKELQKQARAEKIAKKKKLGDGIPKVFKRVKIDPTISTLPEPRPKKKSERASWLPTPEDMPTRASKRKSTKQSKEQLMAQMVDREIKRVKQLESMEKAQAAKEAAKKPAMTQADRLKEAARVEKQNAKSLSKWEEAEIQREEDQLARLAALSNRHMDGPVITWWSGMATYIGGTLKKVGKNLELEDPKEKLSRKRKAAEMEAESAAATAAALATTENPATVNGDVPSSMAEAPNQTSTPLLAPPSLSPQPPSSSDLRSPDATETSSTLGTPRASPANLPLSNPTNPPTNLPPSNHPQSNGHTPDIPTSNPAHLQANVPPHSNYTPSQPPLILPPNPPPQRTYSPIIQPPHLSHNNQPPTGSPLAPPQPYNANLPPPSKSSHPPFLLAPPQQYYPPPNQNGHSPLAPPQQYHPPPPSSLDGSSPLPGFGAPLQPYPRLMPSQSTPFALTSQNHLNQPAPAPPQPPAPPAIEYSALNYVILSNFDEDAIKDKQTQSQILTGRKFIKSKTKPTSTLCVITSNPARFRDPSTGLPYSSAYAYREIQKLKKGEYRWSRLVGAYVGQGTYAARGVPPRFTNPKAQLFLKMAGAGTGAELFVPSGAGGAQGQGQSQTQGQNLVPGVKLSR